eukprot:m.16905 g.16905  ORF g.16905 m.16905 type:complete len:87 (-) comp7262_c0_seq1:512-772(-)
MVWLAMPTATQNLTHTNIHRVVLQHDPKLCILPNPHKLKYGATTTLLCHATCALATSAAHSSGNLCGECTSKPCIFCKQPSPLQRL